MEYHSDRFEDASLLVFNAEKLIAVLPANKKEGQVFSHQGLSYGGLVIKEKIKLEDYINVLKEILNYLEKHKLTSLELKLLPTIYHSMPSEEIEYALFLLEAKLYRRDVLSVIDYSKRPKRISENRRRGLKRAIKHNLVIKEETSLKLFWDKVLIPNLLTQHQKQPVHSINEIESLQAHFPNHIRQFNVYNNDEIVAGATIFETKHVAHAQYISASTNKQELGSLDFLFQHLIEDVFANKKYFDFGISNENAGKQLNKGLLYWKESFGARTISQSFYKIETKNHVKLNAVML